MELKRKEINEGLRVTYGCESWTIKKPERQRIDAFELWCWSSLVFLAAQGARGQMTDAVRELWLVLEMIIC